MPEHDAFDVRTAREYALADRITLLERRIATLEARLDREYQVYLEEDLKALGIN